MLKAELQWARATESPRYTIPQMSAVTGGGDDRSAERDLNASLRTFARRATLRATVEQIEPDHWFAEVSELHGVWGDGVTYEAARESLEESIRAWVELKLRRGEGLPVLSVANIELSQLA